MEISMFARGDPRWQAYWEDMHRSEHVRAYAFAPFVELSGALLCTCADILPPYRRRRAKRLRELGRVAINHAHGLRRSGIGWFTNKCSDALNPLSRTIWSRYVPQKEELPEDRTEESNGLLRSLVQFLSLFEQTCRELEKEGGASAGFAQWYFDHVESLLECGGADAGPHWEFDTIELGRTAIFAECEGLAYAQAMVDDGLSTQTPSHQKKRKPVRMTAELHKLAEDIGVDPHVLKEVFETPHSSWWQQMESFRAKRDEALKRAFGSNPTTNAIDLGSPSFPGGYPHCSPESRDASERSVEMLIAMFLSFPATSCALSDAKPTLA